MRSGNGLVLKKNLVNIGLGNGLAIALTNVDQVL